MERWTSSRGPWLLAIVLLGGCNDPSGQKSPTLDKTAPADVAVTHTTVAEPDATTTPLVPSVIPPAGTSGDPAISPSSVPEIAQPGQWVNLSTPTPEQGKPSAKTPSWPAGQGELALALWPQDALAAFSLLTGDPAKDDLAFTAHLQVPFIRVVRDATHSTPDWAAFDSILDAGSTHFRAWYAVDYRGLPQAAADEELRQVQARIAKYHQRVWIGSVTEVARYVQEYATARLENVENNPATVYFDLKDDLDDGQFNQPLTVKVRLPEGWPGVATRATQAGVGCPISIVVHEGKTYALVEAVPDRGTVMVEF